MPYEMKIIRRVEFGETDAGGLMHFSNYFRFMETAECAFFRSWGSSIQTAASEQHVGWPRVSTSCNFTAPLRFEDEVEVHLLVREIKEKSITYAHIFRKLTGGAPVEVARGSVTVVCVARDKSGAMKAVPIPKAITEKIEVAPPALLK